MKIHFNKVQANYRLTGFIMYYFSVTFSEGIQLAVKKYTFLLYWFISVKLFFFGHVPSISTSIFPCQIVQRQLQFL